MTSTPSPTKGLHEIDPCSDLDDVYETTSPIKKSVWGHPSDGMNGMKTSQWIDNHHPIGKKNILSSSWQRTPCEASYLVVVGCNMFGVCLGSLVSSRKQAVNWWILGCPFLDMYHIPYPFSWPIPLTFDGIDLYPMFVGSITIIAVFFAGSLHVWLDIRPLSVRCCEIHSDVPRLLLRDQIDLGIVNVQSALLLHVEFDRLRHGSWGLKKSMGVPWQALRPFLCEPVGTC